MAASSRRLTRSGIGPKGNLPSTLHQQLAQACKSFETVAIVGVRADWRFDRAWLFVKHGRCSLCGRIRRRQSSLRVARKWGCRYNDHKSGRRVAEASLVFVCTPVGQIPGTSARWLDIVPRAAPITDVGSTKEFIVEAVDGKLPEGVASWADIPSLGVKGPDRRMHGPTYLRAASPSDADEKHAG